MDDGDGRRMIGCPGSVHDRTIINPIMLRFRPIAPRPTTVDTSNGSSPTDIKNAVFAKSRTKRKYVRVKKTSGGCKRRRRKLSDQERVSEDSEGKNIVTLQLLPERTDGDKQPPCDGSWSTQVDHNPSMNKAPVDSSDLAVVESWLTVESMTDACSHMGGVGSTDGERVKNLEADTCPSLISDNLNRVTWVNGAYKKMVTVAENRDGRLPEMVVRLAIKEKLPVSGGLFTCQMRVQNTWREERWSKLVPCDVWRMDFGGFAWRLDLKTALSLAL
ncbi:hypothetical protein HS088_TW06G01121 [Tripterygium wilfordii]|uniref:DUF7950 domain-containing protein n=2 Tax=Tripterygium wilfordii TaxID=458696 RepID=A0A7J7DKQ2_TRIWF|nr:hypothetical protein HS088_TW06G01121 [Tripterygium wilfordii]